MTFFAIPRSLAGRHAPWSGDTWRITAHVLAGGVVGVVTGSIVATLVILSAVLSVTVVFALGTLVALLACTNGFAALQRSRFDAFLGERIPPPADHPSRPLIAALRSVTMWRQVAYHIFALVFDGAGAALVALAWAGGLLLMVTPVVELVAAHNAPDLAAPVGGIAAVLAAPWLARGVAAVDLVTARALLGPNVRAELAERVATVERSRADLVSAADAERRRIERDLHDGMQQRLVTLAMNLGIVRATGADLPEPVRDAIARSHDDAKQALTDLRHIVRGLHPAVLDDLGLDAALSGLVAGSPVPVRLHVDLPRRPPVAVEAVAYFVIAESLTNIVKHARATRSTVDVTLTGELRIVVTDNGSGGADEAHGTGLRGLAQRVASVDGTLTVTSPPGGPTTIQAVLPCAS